MLWLPFFILGHALACFYFFLDYPVALDGYSFPYYALNFLASSCQVFLGLLVCYKLLKKFFSSRVSLITTLSVFTTTSLPYFTFIRNRMSHSGDMLVGFLFLLLFFSFRDQKNRPFAFFILWGFLGGILFNLRPNNILYLIFPLGFWFQNIIYKKSFLFENTKQWFSFFIMTVSFFLTIMPQFITWYVLYGAFAPDTSGMAFIVGNNISGVLKSISNLLYSYSWGVLFVEPIWLLGTIGLIFLFKKDRWISIFSIVVLMGACALPVALGNGASFGQRYLLSALPVLALGLAQVIDSIKGKYQPLLVVLLVLLSIWIYVLLINFNLFINYNAGDYALQAFKNIPQILKVFSNLILPNSYLDYLLFGKIKLIEFKDYFFFIIFPTLHLIFLVISSLLFVKYCDQTLKAKFFHLKIVGIFSTLLPLFLGLLTIAIFFRHPPLTSEKIRERQYVAAASNFLKFFPKSGEFNKILSEAYIKDNTVDELNYLIRGDVKYLKGAWDEAKQYYIKAIEENNSSVAVLQLQRIDLITGHIAISMPLLEAELKKGDQSGKANLWMGIYALDKLDNPEKAIFHFKKSLNINPTQKQAKGLKQIMSQYSLQKNRFNKLGKNQEPLPVINIHMLNTYINKVRLEYQLFSMGGYFVNS